MLGVIPHDVAVSLAGVVAHKSKLFREKAPGFRIHAVQQMDDAKGQRAVASGAFACLRVCLALFPEAVHLCAQLIPGREKGHEISRAGQGLLFQRNPERRHIERRGFFGEQHKKKGGPKQHIQAFEQARRAA